MYRCLLRKYMFQACKISVLKLTQGPRITKGKKSFAMVQRSARRMSGLTYSHCHFKMIASGNKYNFNRQTSTAVLTLGSQTPESVNDVFERYHALLENDSFRPECVVDFTTALCSAIYFSLRWLPWLHNDNKVISFIQIVMNERTHDLLREPLYCHKHFQDIYNYISENCEHIPAKDFPSVLLSLLYSGLDEEDLLVAKLLSKCYGAASELNIEHLRDLTHILQCFGGRNFMLAEKTVCRLGNILDNNLQDIQFQISDLSFSCPVLAAYMSTELLEKCVSAVLHKVQEEYLDLDILTVGSLFRFVHKMSFRADHDKLLQIQELAKSVFDKFIILDYLKSYHISEVCHNARLLRCFTGEVAENLQKQSLELLRYPANNLCIRDISNLLFACPRDVSPSVKQEISQLLLKNLVDADVLTLSNIADNMLDLELCDPDLVNMFQKKVLQNMNKISKFITRLIKVLRLLRERLEFNLVFNQRISETLLKNLDCHQSHDTVFVVVVAQYVFPNVQTIIPAILMDCLLNVIPRCNLTLVLIILNGLEKIKIPWSRSLQNQVFYIRSAIQQNAGELMKTAANASQMAQLVKGLHINSPNRDFRLLDVMMDHYTALTKTMSPVDYQWTVQMFRCLPHPYYHPEVFEALIAFAKNNHTHMKFLALLDLVNILAKAAYQPKDFDDFSAFAVKVLEAIMKEKNHIGQISLAYYLSMMQIFPDSILGQIFTFDYLEEIDSFIEAEPDRQLFLKNQMMQLNRSVILECPHLDVPWFHDQFCRERMQDLGNKDFRKSLAFADEVEGILWEVFGGLQFVEHNVYSPYFHPIDFEIVLDIEGKPISIADVKQLNSEERKYQRLAVMLIDNRRLCANSHRRRGQYLQDRRQLEILGYRVEEISRYDWNSMALSDWEAKVDFVRSKLFPDLSKEQKSSPSKRTLMHPYWK